MFKKNKLFITIVTVLLVLIILVPIAGWLWAKHETTTVTVSPSTTTSSQLSSNRTKKQTTNQSSKVQTRRSSSINQQAQKDNTGQQTAETSTTHSSVENTTPSSGQENSNSATTPVNYTVDQAVAIVTAYYDRSGLSPTNVTFAVSDPTKVLVDQGNQYYWHVIGSVDGSPYMAYDVQLANGTIRESYLYGEGQATFVPAP